MVASVPATVTRSQRLVLGVATALAVTLLTGCEGDPRDGTAIDEPRGGATSAAGAASRLREGAAVTLEQYVATATDQLQGMVGSFGGTCSETRIVAAPPNGIEYVFTFAEPVDSSIAKQAVDVLLPTFRTAFRTVIAPEMRT